MKKRILKWFAYFLCFMAVFTIVSRILFVVCTPRVTVTGAFSGEIKKSVEASGVDVLELCGNSGILFDSAVWLDYRDSTKCLVSDGLAYELFGTTDVTGLTVMWQKREYQVIGNIETGKR